MSDGCSKILWADVGERLGVNTTELRSLRNTFGDLLGLDYSKNVSEAIVPVLSRIESLRREGVTDDEIRERIQRLPRGPEWPEEVLSRMQHAATAVSAVLPPEDPPKEASPVKEAAKEAPSRDTDDRDETPTAQTPSEGGPADTWIPDESLSEETLREIVFDLRREIATSAMSERELVLRLIQYVQRLTLEVRDLRYAFLLASSRKDRKKGVKAISRLLSG